LRLGLIRRNALHLLGLALILVHLAVLRGQHSVALALFEGAIYLCAAWMVLAGRTQMSLAFILVIAALLRLAFITDDPFHSTDIYRYIWDGRVQGAGINPYRYLPNDPSLAVLRDQAIWPYINRADHAPTIYPPVAQMIFFLVTRVSESVLYMKSAMLLFEMVAVVCLLKLLDLDGLPRERVLLYVWHPLPAWEFVGSGHIDAAMVAFVALAVLARRTGAYAAAGAALAAGTLVKLFPLVLVPALWRRWDWRFPVAFLAVVGLAYLPYVGVGSAVLGYLPGYVREEGVDDGSGLWLVEALRSLGFVTLPTSVYLAGVVLVMAALALFVMFRMPEAERATAGALVLASTATLAVSPHYPWYFAWLIPFLCFRPYWPLLWLTAAAFILYVEDARYVLWMGGVLYGGFAVLALIDLARRRPATLLRRPA
jgi:alpha-1,6-mannosyltransferase